MKLKLLVGLLLINNHWSYSTATNISFIPDLKPVNDTFICLDINNKFIRIDFINPSVYRIRVNSLNSFPEGGMVRYRIVSTHCNGHPVQQSVKKEGIVFSSDKTALYVNEKDGKIKLLDSDGNIILQNDEPPITRQEKGFDLSFKLRPDEKLYGFGDESRDSIQKRGHKNKMVITNVTSYIPIPFVMSDKGWGIFLNTTVYHSFDAGATVKDRLSFSSDHGYIDYFLISGDSLPDILDKYTGITGKPALLPKWGYGLTFICDERGVRARDVLYEAYEFRRQQIPCDVIGLEPDWMNKHYDFSIYKQWSQERFHKPRWQNGNKSSSFTAGLNNMNFKLSLWLCTDYDFSEYEELQIKSETLYQVKDFERKSPGDYLNIHAHPVYLDTLTKPGVPWFDHLKKFVDDGASAFKMDGANQVYFHPDRKWKNGMEDYEMHNLYPLLYSKQMNLGFRDYTGRRAMLYTAAGYSGIQRYAATWAGDTGGGSGTLVSLLNHGLSGHSNVCSDMEVFSAEGIHYGFFQTLPVVLSWWMYNQPWFQKDNLPDLFKSYANLRYKIMPYIYSMAHVASKNALPVMRAMPLAFPGNPGIEKYIHQFMFGDAFLVSAFDSVVYLPNGNWIDYWTNQKVKGNREIKASYPKNRGGSLFVREGAIIPTQDVKGYIGTETPENICWEIFPGGNSKFTLYEDDGETNEYLKGEFSSTLVECMETDENIKIIIYPRKGGYTGMPSVRTHSMKIFYPCKIVVENSDILSTYSMDDGLLVIHPVTETNEAIELKINIL